MICIKTEMEKKKWNYKILPFLPSHPNSPIPIFHCSFVWQHIMQISAAQLIYNSCFGKYWNYEDAKQLWFANIWQVLQEVKHQHHHYQDKMKSDWLFISSANGKKMKGNKLNPAEWALTQSYIKAWENYSLHSVHISAVNVYHLREKGWTHVGHQLGFTVCPPHI